VTADYRILIVGGYGTFGGRLVELLENEARLTLLVAGRSIGHARAYCARRTATLATLVPTAFDRINGTAKDLAALQATVVVDASGPFQSYGTHRYGLIERCIECGVNYLDLADGSAFVTGVTRFDEAARAAGVYILSGASSFPVLTAAVVRRLTGDVARITSIRGGIAPSPYAGVGLNVIRAIASYAGQPIALKRAGELITAYPITESLRFVIRVPGHVPLRYLRFSLVDVPDLQALSAVWPEAGDIWMGAAPVPAILHWLLTGFAWLVRLRLLPSLLWMATAIHRVTHRVRWGEHRGGMFVEIRGQLADDALVRREWHLLAEGSDGPLIPSMAAAAVIRKCLAGQVPPPGARTAIDAVNLSDYESLFAQRAIFTGIRQREPAQDQPLFHALLGDAWDRLPLPIRRLHSPASVSIYSGRCAVTRGTNFLARMVAGVAGFPTAGQDQPITVQFCRTQSGERWVRTVAHRTFASSQSRPTGRSEGLLRERFGPVAVDMALRVESSGLKYVVRRWLLLGIPLPLWLGPRTAAIESVDGEGRFNFDITLWHPFMGLLVRYAGWLCANSESAQA
jgi:hypothetical protein